MSSFRILNAMMLAVALASCGEGGTGGTGFDPPDVVTKSVSIGQVSSVQESKLAIGGVDYPLQNAAIFLNGVETNVGALKPGMVVRVEAAKNSQGKISVDAVRFWNMVAGRISDNKNGVLTVNTQKISVTKDTALDGVLRVTDLQKGLHVSILGLAGDKGDFVATHIQSLPVGDFDWVAGLMQMVDFRTIAIGDVKIDISLIKSPPPLANGRYIMVRGAVDKVDKKLLHAYRIWSDFAETPDVAVEMDGVVRDVYGNHFRLWGRDITFDPANSVIEGGAWGDLSAKPRVHVWGRSEGGNLIADRVRIDPIGAAADMSLPSRTARLLSMVTSFDGNTGEMKVLGLPNTPFTVDSDTVLVGWDVNDIRANYTVRAQLAASSNQAWRVTRLALLEKEPADDVEIIGRLTADVTRDANVTPNSAYVAFYNDALTITPVCAPDWVIGDGENATCLILGDTLPVANDWVKLQGTYLPVINRRLTWVNLDKL